MVELVTIQKSEGYPCGKSPVVGLNVLDLRLVAEASGEIVEDGVTRSGAEVLEAKQVAPLPLIGLNFTTRYTPEWSVATRVGFARHVAEWQPLGPGLLVQHHLALVPLTVLAIAGRVERRAGRWR